MSARSPGFIAVIFLASVFATTTVLSTVDIDPAEAAPRKVRKKKGTTGISKNRPIAGVKGGFVISGEGKTEIEGQSVMPEYEDKSTVGLSGYALFPVAPGIRVGGSVWLWPKWDVTENGDPPESADDDALGLDVNVMGEYALDFGKADGFAFAEGGYSLVLPAKDDEPAPFSGFNVGGGIGGALYLSNQVALRADIKYEFYSVTAEQELGGTTRSATYAGSRISINFGIAFGL